MGEEKELKVGMLTKRAQQKKSISRTNYKERVFVLTQTHLAYHEGSVQHRGRIKERFSLDSISFVGAIYDEALHRTSTFLIVHEGCYLYCCAKDIQDRDIWIEAIKRACQALGNTQLGQLKYHPRIYSHGKWQCCSKRRKSGEGCKLIDEHEENTLSTLSAALTGYSYSRSAPGSPSNRHKLLISSSNLASSTPNSSSENLVFAANESKEQEKMFRDFHSAISGKLTWPADIHNVKSHKSKSESNLHHFENEKSTSLAAKPLPLIPQLSNSHHFENEKSTSLAAKPLPLIPQLSNSHHFENEKSTSLAAKPLPLIPQLSTQTNNFTNSNDTHTLSLAECCNELFSTKQKSSKFSQVSVSPTPTIPKVTVSDENYKTVVALYNYTPIEREDIPLEVGKKYSVIDDSRQHWWIVRSEYGVEGYVPANYLKDEMNEGLEAMSWFQLDMSRQRAEHLLKQDAKEGSFVVRKSTQAFVIYSLSVLTRCGKSTGQASVRHYHIKQNDRGFYFSEKHPMSSVMELIRYHQHNAGGLVTRLRNAPSSLEASGGKPNTHLFSNSQWEMNIKDFKMIQELGSGQFGVVNLALYRGKTYVAVKIMKENTMQEDSFIEEAQVMTKLQHRNLVELYGVVTNQRPICIVTEYMKEGCLLDFVRNQPGMHEHHDLLLDISCQVCDAMKYLEEKLVIHRDLAARNCLVGKNMLIKVGDFGLARYVLDDEYTSSVGGKFPVKWAPPEVLNYSRFSSKSDVWSFGILMWELFTGGKVPYPSMTNSEVAIQITQGYRLSRPFSCPHDVYHLMQLTWHDESVKRPTFLALYDKIYEINDNINAVCVPAGMQHL